MIKRDEINLLFRMTPTRATLRGMDSSLNSTFWFPLPRSVWETASIGLRHLLGRKERTRLYCLLAERTRLARMVTRTTKQSARLASLNQMLDALRARFEQGDSNGNG